MSRQVSEAKPNGSFNTTRRVFTTLGAIVGVAGLEHGIGEALQGNIAPAGIVIQSWPNSVLYESLAGEPAMTLVPNMLLSGVLTILVSLALVHWVILHADGESSGKVLILLSMLLLLVGGGFGPPILGVIIGLVYVWRRAGSRWLFAHTPKRALRVASAVWRIVFAACVLGWLSLWPGSVILAFLTGYRSSIFVAAATTLSLSTLLLSLFTGLARDCVS